MTCIATRANLVALDLGHFVLRTGDDAHEMIHFRATDHGGWFVTYGEETIENALVLDTEGHWVAATYHDLATAAGEDATTWTSLEHAVEAALATL